MSISALWQGRGESSALDGNVPVESERTVNVLIRRLQEKVALEPGKPRLTLTVPGIGYRLLS
jgi:DNA-binding response OmpR family regulator